MAPGLCGPVGPMPRRRDLPEAKRTPAPTAQPWRGRFAQWQTRDAAFDGQGPLREAPGSDGAMFMGQGEPRLMTQ